MNIRLVLFWFRCTKVTSSCIQRMYYYCIHWDFWLIHIFRAFNLRSRIGRATIGFSIYTKWWGIIGNNPQLPICIPLWFTVLHDISFILHIDCVTLCISQLSRLLWFDKNSIYVDLKAYIWILFSHLLIVMIFILCRNLCMGYIHHSRMAVQCVVFSGFQFSKSIIKIGFFTKCNESCYKNRRWFSHLYR